MVKHSARDFRALARKVRQLENALAARSAKSVPEEGASKQNAAGDMAATKRDYVKKLALEMQTNVILRQSLKNFSGPLYTIKRANRKLRHENKMLAYALKCANDTNGHLTRGLSQLKTARRAKKRKRGVKRSICI